MCSDPYEVLTSRDARLMLGFDEFSPDLGDSHFPANEWTFFVSQSITKSEKSEYILTIGNAAFDAFLQANVTGPPIQWDPAVVVFPARNSNENSATLTELRKRLASNLTIDGEALYQHIPHIELFYLAKCILNRPWKTDFVRAILLRLRVNFWHQRMLNDVSPTLQKIIYEDLDLLNSSILTENLETDLISPAHFLVERAAIHTHHGLDGKAREDLEKAAQERSFSFALTGRLGKRTKFQEKQLSQLVVLAKSSILHHIPSTNVLDKPESLQNLNESSPNFLRPAPKAVDLNDDTLLESISFSAPEKPASASERDSDLPAALQDLDPANQPLLEPLDSIILLATASSITDTSPIDGLNHEMTLPYAERVINGGSSNWQVYTQALLVRSRIEGYRSRTIERGVLQLQAVVDQVIAETASGNPASTSFLPQSKKSESAPAPERLQYIHQLASPPRWKLESELADRWITLGALQTALEIYERLQMWAEVALCLAANDREDEARIIMRRQLYNSNTSGKDQREDEYEDIENYKVEKDPLPEDAPRLFCILGDIEESVSAYERAWEVSNRRYARAQRSLGRLYFAAGDLQKADTAYSQSLRVNPQNHATAFALGCIRLQLEDWSGAVDAFARAVQIDDTDAESWSNLAVALLRTSPSPPSDADGELNTHESPTMDPQKNVREAFIALKRAAALKRDSFRIWQNLLSVSVKLSSPPYTDIIVTQTRLIELLGRVEGEKCVDVEIVEALVSHLVATTSPPSQRAIEETNGGEPSKRTGFEKMLINLVQKRITPLITSSRRLWLLTAKLSLHLEHPSAALASFEKAWRVTLNQPGWETGGGIEASKKSWKEVWESTVDLADAYESLGERKKESGLGAGELVAKDWKFKARSAVRSVLAKAKEGRDGDEGYEILNAKLNELKSG